MFKQLTGMDVTEYVVFKRVILAKELLVRSDDSIKTICEKCGMESESYYIAATQEGAEVSSAPS
ncbi:AraC family transcriptional regulator [Paenibacillus sp. sptzw28]|nr:AraC family transcriptional regulator [Paenibacillus sp. sptzw28]QYR23059.1 AraC family transcriptional regulator [Paenibacillus sp. sptzw28]